MSHSHDQTSCFPDVIPKESEHALLSALEALAAKCPLFFLNSALRPPHWLRGANEIFPTPLQGSHLLTVLAEVTLPYRQHHLGESGFVIAIPPAVLEQLR